MSFITFIIPSIGRLELSRALDSLLTLPTDDWDAIIIFDGVKNNLQQKYLNNNKFKFIEVVKCGKRFYNNNLLISSAGFVRNIGLNIAESEWIGFLDDDDIIYGNYITDLKKELLKNTELDFILFKMNADKLVPRSGIKTIVKNEVGISFCVKRQFIINNNIKFSQGGVEDFEFAATVVKHGAKYIVSDSIVYEVCKDNRDKVNKSNKTVFVFRECDHTNLTPIYVKEHGVGGTDHVTLSFTEYLSSYFTVKICCPIKSRKYFGKVEYIPFLSHIQVCEEIFNIKPDIIIVVGNPKLIYDKNYNFHKNTIFWQHNHPDEMRQFNIKSMLLDKGINIVLPSFEAAEFCKKYYENETQIFGIYNGIRDEFFVKHNFIKRQFVIGYIGCLTKQKGVWELLCAAKQLPEYRFNIYGSFNLYGENTVDFEFKKDCDELIKQSSNILMMGSCSPEQLSKNIQSLDLVVANPNIGNKETCCLSALEAMACGTPVIVGGKSIIDPIISHGGIAYTGDLAKTILGLTTDRDKMNELRETGLEFTRRLTWKNIIKHWVGFLEENYV